MRRVLGWLLVVIGALVFAPSLAAALWVGTDDTASTGPHRMTTAGVAIATAPEVLHYVGPVLHLTVESSDGAPVFVGIAHDIDTTSYLGEQSRRDVTRVGLPWDVESGEREGSTDALAAPDDQPWWLVSATGDGPQELVWPLPHGRYSVVALNADGTPGVDVEVTLGLEIAGTFYTLLAIATAGLLLVLLGVWLLLRRRRAQRMTAEQARTEVGPRDDQVAGSAGEDTVVVASRPFAPPATVSHPVADAGTPDRDPDGTALVGGSSVAADAADRDPDAAALGAGEDTVVVASRPFAPPATAIHPAVDSGSPDRDDAAPVGGNPPVTSRASDATTVGGSSPQAPGPAGHSLPASDAPAGPAVPPAGDAPAVPAAPATDARPDVPPPRMDPR